MTGALYLEMMALQQLYEFLRFWVVERNETKQLGNLFNNIIISTFSSAANSKCRKWRSVLLLRGVSHKRDTDFYIFLQNIYTKECSILQVLLEVHTTDTEKRLY